jgi:hypothetical protein
MEELRKVLTRTSVATEERLGARVAIAEDYYWHLSVTAAFDMTREPSSLTAGQVSDDL